MNDPILVFLLIQFQFLKLDQAEYPIDKVDEKSYKQAYRLENGSLNVLMHAIREPLQESHQNVVQSKWKILMLREEKKKEKSHENNENVWYLQLLCVYLENEHE